MDPRGARGADRPPNPRARASPLSALTFGWVLGTFWRGYQRDLEVDDLTQPLTEHRSDLLGDVFEKYWADEQRRAARRKGARPSLTRVIVRAFGVRLALYGIVLAIMEIVLRVAQPIFLGQLVLSFSNDSEVPRDAAMGYAAGVVLCSAANIFVIHPYMMAIFHMGMKMRVGSCSLLYRKALRLSKTALGDTTAGQVVNLLANDVARFDLAVIFLHYLWIGPVETVLATYVMYRHVGIASVIGVATILMFIPLQGQDFLSDFYCRQTVLPIILKKTSTLRLRTAMRTDERVRLMNEIISGVQVIKMYAWEIPFNKLVTTARKQELKCLTQTSYIRGVVLSFIMFNTRISIFTSILSYVFTGGAITAEKVFLITAYYNILRQTMTVFFPQGLTQLAEAFVSIRRIEVLSACALRTDLQQLPYSDKTIVGERGISLSGGQRARINLARAVYKEADIYLLDDPLSAVDSHVGKHLFDECIKGYLAGKVVVLITHQLQYLKDVDKIYVMENGSVRQEGTFVELQESGTDLSQLIENDSNDTVEAAKKERTSTPLRTSRASMSSVDEKSIKVPLEEEESRSRGTVAGHVYTRYFAAGGNCCVIFMMFVLCAAAQVAASGADYWITYWTRAEQYSAWNQNNSSNSSDTFDDVGLEEKMLSREDCIYIYAGIIGAVVVLSLVRSFVFFKVCIRASQRLHDAMFYCVTHAKMRFFNTNPSGRILNRFSKDMGAVDEILPQCMVDTLQIGLALLGIIAVLAVVNYWLLIPTLVIGFMFYLMRQFYLSTSRSVKRLEGVTRSPVFSHMNASLQGLTTIRAFGAENILVKEFDNHQDLHSSAWYVFIATSRAFGFWLDIICVAYITIVTFSFLIIGTNVFGGNVGLAITQAIALTGMFQWGMRQSAEMENQMTSVERIMEYKNVEQEPPLESAPGKKPPPDWPQKGHIVFDQLSLKYNASEAAVGIVGRTGAGKSSLISALFRLAELEGTILLDDVDTGSIGLHDLRQKISIIPQEPVLFTGTLRKNLDPFDEFTDAALLRALDEVSEGGSNFSVGQRQLVCLARAILRDNRVLVLDEATANVDPQTDALIQRTIRQKFASCTVLTIAHRLHTVMDSDRVLVMDGGCMVEFGHPHDLLQNTEGHFYKMVQMTGRGMAEQLAKIAEGVKKRTPSA
ncbi:Putative multidrug resistance-associated protein [Gryllus bimaculatus]|nr:Putative multidrug resistance-associated protein [Gryllus bimaculatus]